MSVLLYNMSVVGRILLWASRPGLEQTHLSCHLWQMKTWFWWAENHGIFPPILPSVTDENLILMSRKS